MGFIHGHYFYFVLLIFSLIGMVVLDWRYHLLFFDHPKVAWKPMLGMVTILLIGDLIGIEWNIFSTNPQYVLGIYLGSHNLPVEEILFLILLSYFTLNLYLLLKRGQHSV